jgi:hypothetical protein
MQYELPVGTIAEQAEAPRRRGGDDQHPDDRKDDDLASRHL